MKKLITLLLLAPLFYNGEAKLVSKEEALLKAKDFLKKDIKEDKILKKKGYVEESYENDNFYIFNALDKQGFVIVSADDCAPSILGYSFNNQISEDKLPCNVEWLLQYYNKSIDLLKSNNIKNERQEQKRPINPIIHTQWGQSFPYNELCPQLNEEEQCITGCVATAMAQVIFHHRWPQGQTSEIPGYVTDTYHLSLPKLEPTIFDWNNMSNANISRLMLYCGQAVHMDYSPYASGAYFPIVGDAMKNFFGYSNAINYIDREGYNDDQWNDLVYAELENGSPVLYSGLGADGGHAFIVDGYDDGKFHVNWGWEGYCDGYFLLTGLNPAGSNGFNSGQGIISNACPPVGSDNIQRPKTVVNNINCTERNLQRESSYDAFPAFNVIANIQSDLNIDATIEIGIALYDDSGMVKLMHSEVHDFVINEEYEMENNLIIDSRIPIGQYRLVTVNRMKDSEDWLMDGGATSKYIELTIDETDLHLQPIPKSNEDLYFIDFGYHEIDGLNYHLYSEYDNLRAKVIYSSEYSGDIYVPDYVQYQNMTFKIWEIDGFFNLSDLISLSIPVRCTIVDNPNLQSIELRESITRFDYPIHDCPSLKEITYPQNCSEIYLPFICNSLETINIKNTRNVIINVYADNLLNAESLPSLKEIYFSSDLPPILTINYEKTDSYVINPEVTIHVPQNTIETYRAQGWNEWKIVEDQPALPIYVEWDYCGKDYYIPCGVICGRGDNDVEFAFYIPSEYLQAYMGCNICTIEYYTPNPSINDYQYEDIEYVFITSSGKDYLTKKSVSTTRGCWMRVELDEPYVITGEELFIGVGRHSVLGMNWANEEIVPNGFWLRAMGNDEKVPLGIWEQNAGCLNIFNNPLPIRAIITGENLPNDIIVENVKIADEVNNDNYANSFIQGLEYKTSILQLLSHNEVFTFTIDENHNLIIPSNNSQKLLINDNKNTNDVNQDTKTLNLKIKNRSPHKVKEIVFDYEIDGSMKGSLTHNTNLLPNHSESVNFEIPDQIQGRSHEINLVVSTIDGESDEIPANSEVNTYIFIKGEKKFPRKIVMEEATGTWCGYCPRGIVAMESMKKNYPDNFIGVAIHNDDLFPAFDSYNPFFDQVGSYPNAIINRSYWIDPWPFEINEDNNKTEVLVKTSARFLPGGEEVAVETKTIFDFDDVHYDNYRLAYVLVENNVGPLFQANYYSDPESNPEDDEGLNWWVKQDSYVEILFNDVARAIYDYEGIAGSFSNAIIKNEEYITNYTLQLPDNILNVENLNLVVFLIDTISGEILNADIADIEDDNNAGIEIVVTKESESFDVYNLMGIKIRNNVTELNNLSDGIYIVNNKKILIK